MGGPHSVHRWPEWDRKADTPGNPSCLTVPRADARSFLLQAGTDSINCPGSQAFRLELDYTTSLPGPPACGWQILELLSFHNSMSQLFIISLFIEKSRDRETEILLVLFLWRSPNNSEPQLHHLLTRWPKTNGIASPSLSLSLSLSLYIYIYIYIYIYTGI